MPVKTISKLLATAVVHCSTDDDIAPQIIKAVEKHTDFFKGIGDSLDKTIPGFSLITTIGKGLTKALTPEIMGGLVDKIEYSKIREFIIEPNPNKLNHDLSKLLKKSAVTALGYLKCLWFEKLKAEGDKEQIKLLEGVFEQMKADMISWLDYETIEETILSDPTDCLNAITDYIFTTSSVNRASAFAEFFVDMLPFCFRLAYKEALKDSDNQKGLIAFQIWILESIHQKNDLILAEIKALKITLSGSSSSVSPLPQHLTGHPLVPEVFRGRESEVKKIHQLLFEGENLLLLVNGEGGIGKTSLAAKYYQQYTAHYKHLAWVVSEPNMTEALLRLAVPLNLTFDDTADTAQRLELLLTRMANMDRPCLLILDNANEVADLQENYEHLRRCPNFHVLLTSRLTEYRRAQFYKIDSLPREQALAVFREHYPKLQTDDEPIFEGIYDAVGGNTLVLELLAKNLAQQNTLKTKYQLANLLADLQTKGLLQIVEADDVAVDYQSYRTVKPTEIIAAMYDLSKLSEAESRLLSVFALLPTESIAFEVAEQLLPQTPNLDKILLNLAQKGWLSYTAADSSFKCSPVIQEIAAAKNKNLYADAEEMLRTLIDKLDYEPGVGTLRNAAYAEGLLWVRYAESAVSNLEDIQYNLAWLCERVGNFHTTHGNIEKGIIYSEKCILIFEKLTAHYPENEDFKNGLAISYEKLGDLQQALGNLDKALTYFEDETVLFEELYRDYPNQVGFKNGLAISYSKLGTFYRDTHQIQKAGDYYEKCKALWEELVQNFPLYAEFQRNLTWVKNRLSNLGE
ncbi:MAG: tetratricopeptide repeat protein [Spirosomataceae bacterium]